MESPQLTPTDETGPAPTTRGRSRRVFAGLAATAALAVGGLTVAAINPLGSAGATGAETTTTAAPSASGAAGVGGVEQHRSKVLDEALSSLVTDGTLTQAQADAVRTRIRDTAKTVHADRAANRKERRQDMATTAAKALGISTAELHAKVKDGATIAQIATDRGVDIATVTQALTTESNSLIDRAVTAGKIDAGKADAAKARVAERINTSVNEGPRRGRN